MVRLAAVVGGSDRSVDILWKGPEDSRRANSQATRAIPAQPKTVSMVSGQRRVGEHVCSSVPVFGGRCRAFPARSLGRVRPYARIHDRHHNDQSARPRHSFLASGWWGRAVPRCDDVAWHRRYRAEIPFNSVGSRSNRIPRRRDLGRRFRLSSVGTLTRVRRTHAVTDHVCRPAWLPDRARSDPALTFGP